jgi:hypothetical protein
MGVFVMMHESERGGTDVMSVMIRGLSAFTDLVGRAFVGACVSAAGPTGRPPRLAIIFIIAALSSNFNSCEAPYFGVGEEEVKEAEDAAAGEAEWGEEEEEEEEEAEEAELCCFPFAICLY